MMSLSMMTAVVAAILIDVRTDTSWRRGLHERRYGVQAHLLVLQNTVLEELLHGQLAYWLCSGDGITHNPAIG